MQDLATLTTFFGWCSVINVGLLLYATLMLSMFGTWVRRIHKKLFGLSDVELLSSYFEYLANYKIAILIFNIAPYVALKIMS